APIDDRRCLPTPADREQIFPPNAQPRWNGVFAVIGVDVALELRDAIRRKTLDELPQRTKTARVPVPDVVGAAGIGVADALLECQIESLSEQSFDVGGIAPSQRR